MAKTIPCCFNCAYAFLDREHSLECYEAGLINWPACANHPECGGRMRRTPPRGMCPNYRLRPAGPEGEFRQIPLGDGIYAYVDAADFEWLSQWTWFLGHGYAYRQEKGKVIYMHRQIMQPPQGMVVHHKSRNKLDNTRENMENVTSAENARHRVKKRNTSSRFWGVSYIKQHAKYQACVHYKGKGVACGWFTDEIEAARAHDYKAVELKGELARLNFPKEWPPERRAQVYAQGAAARQRLETRARQKERAKEDRRKKAGPRRGRFETCPTPMAKTTPDGVTTNASPRATKSKRPTGHKPRATKKARAETRRRKGGKRQTRAKPAKPRATRDKRRATKSERA